eukprot:386394-Prymnesium_polylepis.1
MAPAQPIGAALPAFWGISTVVLGQLLRSGAVVWISGGAQLRGGGTDTDPGIKSSPAAAHS